MKIAIDISLVSELPDTPHFNDVNWGYLIESSSALGYDGIELLPKSAEDFPSKRLKVILQRNEMELCVIGTGAGRALYNYSFTDPDITVRKKAVDYVSALIQIAGEFNSMILIGAMQGSIQKGGSRQQALGWLSECVFQLAEVSEKNHVILLIEPLNRYETNLINSLSQGSDLIHTLTGVTNVRLVADLFHMNIEETNIAESIFKSGKLIAHYHLADSNRLAPGMGHTDFIPIAAAIHATGYEGYCSVECFTKNNLRISMQKSINTFMTFFKNQRYENSNRM